MSAQIRIQKVGVPREKDTAIPLDTVSSAPPPSPARPKLDVGSTSAMTTNNMPKGRQV